MFFITGLPRSRTAWFSEFFTASGFYCYHELLRTVKNKKEFYEKIKDKGNSDCGMFITDFQKVFKRPKTVVIDRNSKDVQRSLKAKGLIVDLQLLEGIRKINLSLYGLHVKYDDINSKIDDIFEYCTGVKPDKEIKDRLLDLNIQGEIHLNTERNVKIWS